MAVNAIGEGFPSETISLTPAALPSTSQLIEVTEYGSNYLWLMWATPLDTGIGDQSLSVTSYELQVDEGFGSGFVPLTDSKYTSLQFKHESLILGH
jgi:hypothetical protein